MLFLKNRLFLYLTIGAVLFSLNCAVLTKSQLSSIHNFAELSQSYSEIPADILDGYREIRKENDLMKITNRIFDDEADADSAWSALMRSQKMNKRLVSESGQLRATLNILTHYSELLLLLSSDKFVDEFATHTKSLSQTLQNDIAEYNQKYQKNIVEMSRILGDMVMQLGGLCIRRKQTKLLKRYIFETDTIIADLTTDIADFTEFFVDDTVYFDAALTAEQKALKNIFKTRALSNQTNFPYFYLKQVDAQTQKIEEIRQLSKLCLDASKNYREAHAVLRELTNRKQNIVQQIEAVQKLATQINSIK